MGIKKRVTKAILIRAGAIALVVFLVGAVLIRSDVANKAYAAAPGDVIINELMYNPNTGNQLDEFLELYNTTGSSIDLSGWSFSAGITLTFAPGTSIPASGYIVISPSISQTFATYGVVATEQYSPSNLSNGGETVTLVDDSLAVMDTVNYDDVSPWPTSPDGTGPSLELKGTGLDNSIATNWGASSANAGTPLAQNSQVGLNLPVITNVTDPNDILDTDTVHITATVTGSTTVNLHYKINFDSDVTLGMFDDGAHDDGAAADNVYGAQIPSQAQKTLVRFKVDAVNGSGTKTSPSNDDSIDYHGYYVKDPSLTSTEPILDWFISDADYTAMYATADNFGLTPQFPCVIVYGNDVFDSAAVRIKGSNTLFFPKKNIKIDLPAGYTLTMPDIPYAINEFHLNANYKANDSAKIPTIFWANKQAGIEVASTQLTRLQKNGEFEGAYFLVDKFKSGWRDLYNRAGGSMFEDYWSVEFGATDNTELVALKDRMVLDRKDPQKRGYVLDDNNIPALINYMAMVAITHHHDYSRTQNTMYFKSSITGRWELMPWDHDGDLIPASPKSMINSWETYTENQDETRFMLNAIYEQPDLRAAYYRRLATLVEKYYANDTFKNKYQELSAVHSDLSALDQAKWPTAQRELKESDEAAMDKFKLLFSTLYREDWAIPRAQTLPEKQSVSISSVNADADNTNEYIRLSNAASTPVDISGWTIEGISYTIPAGSVIPANGEIYILRDDIGYRASHTAVLVAGQYTNDLGGSGTLTLKTDSGVTIDNETY